MGLLQRLFGERKPVDTASEVVRLVRETADAARSVVEFRQALADKAKRGDLDRAWQDLQAANARAQAYMRGRGE